MAGFIQQFLGGAWDGFTDTPLLRDYRHASEIFVNRGYDNAPKNSWQFHVYFKINNYMLPEDLAKFVDSDSFGVLVKTIDLPKIDAKVEELNQYNRKRLVQTKVTYSPIRVTFHDDNAGRIRRLWQAYFAYHYHDPKQPGNASARDAAATQLNTRNIYDSEISSNLNTWGYSGDPSRNSDSKIPFFASVEIYGFGIQDKKRVYSLYNIINPVIENFSQGTYSYSDPTGVMENTMTLRFETIKYHEGAFNDKTMSGLMRGFGDKPNYDTTPSPLSTGVNPSIKGAGGLFDTGKGILGDLQSGNYLGALQKAGKVSQTFKNVDNLKRIAKSELIAGATSAITNPEFVKNNIVTPIRNVSDKIHSSIQNSTKTKGMSSPPIVGDEGE